MRGKKAYHKERVLDERIGGADNKKGDGRKCRRNNGKQRAENDPRKDRRRHQDIRRNRRKGKET